MTKLRDSKGRFPKIPVQDRIWNYITIDEATGCWNWTGVRNRRGYGRVVVEGKIKQVHRVMYELKIGPIPDGLVIDHLCRNTSCANPAHMEPVTEKINTLRGCGPAAKNAKAIHCRLGHPYDLANTYRTPKGRRDCRICRREAARRWREKIDYR